MPPHFNKVRGHFSFFVQSKIKNPLFACFCHILIHGIVADTIEDILQQSFCTFGDVLCCLQIIFAMIDHDRLSSQVQHNQSYSFAISMLRSIDKSILFRMPLPSKSPSRPLLIDPDWISHFWSITKSAAVNSPSAFTSPAIPTVMTALSEVMDPNSLSALQ